MKLLSVLLLYSMAFVAGLFAAPLKQGEMVYFQQFSGQNLSDALDGWQRIGEVDSGKITVDKDGLLIELPPSKTPESLRIVRDLPVKHLRDTILFISAEVKATDVSPRPQPWNGPIVRVQVTTEFGASNSGGGMANAKDTSYPQATFDHATFEWTKAGFLVTVPENAESASLQLGLEATSGKMRIRNVSVKVVREPDTRTIAKIPGPPYYKGHPLSRLRGVEVSYAISEEDMRVLSEEWNVNAIRWQIGESTFADGLETAHYDDVLRRELLQLDRVLTLCRKYNIGLILNLQSLSKKLFHSRENQEKLAGVWRTLAARYKDDPYVIAYDFANEPIQTNWREGARLWNDLAQYISEGIRKVDPDKPIIVEADIMSLPDGFRTLKPVSVPNVVYSVHVYSPGDLTHNRVWDKNQKPYPYPGIINGELWNKDRIRQDLEPVRRFQEKYGGHILVGEFGAVRWAPGSDQYIGDMIELFEEYGWDWIYHSYREWHGWSAEHGQTFELDDISDSVKHSPVQTEREKLLRSWFGKNERFPKQGQ